MAAIDIDTLIATIRFRGDYQNDRKFPRANLVTELQTSFGEFWQLVAEAHQGWWDTEGVVTTTVDQPYVALPADCKSVQAIDRADDQYELSQVGLEQRNNYGTGGGQPCAYRLTARGADIYPVPNAAYDLRVLYTSKAPTLETAPPQEWYDGWEDYVITSTLLKLDTREQRPLTDRITMLDKIEKRLRASTGDRRAQEPEYLNLREGSGGFDPFHERNY